MENNLAHKLFAILSHPYPRYGLAAALVQKRLSPREFVLLEETQISTLLQEAIEESLGSFRMKTFDDPAHAECLEFHNIAFEDLQEDTSLVQSSGLAGKGIYLFPSVVTTDGGAIDTYKNSISMLKDLKNSKSLLDTKTSFSRSFAPTTAKINQNGKTSLSEPPGTLFEAVCSVIATLTPLKPAAWTGAEAKNTAIYPDLPLNEKNTALWEFVRLFEEMGSKHTVELMKCHINRRQSLQTAMSAKRSKKTEKATSTSPYRRPRLHNGNYPDAPQRDGEVFGVAGLLGAIGRWAYYNGQIARGKSVLNSLSSCPIYVINYNKIYQCQFNNFVISLAKENRLSDIVRALSYDTRLYTEIETDQPNWEAPARKLFLYFTNRFLQSFDYPSFRDFLATRAEYPRTLIPLFEEYFMRQQQIPEDIVTAAMCLGQWINRAAYFAAKREVEAEEKNNKDTNDLNRKIRQRKSRLLVALDSIAMGARDSSAMLGSIMRETRMLTDNDAPMEAIPFLNAANTGSEIKMETARQLLMTYMRVSHQTKPHRPATEALTSDSDIEANIEDEDETPGYDVEA